MNDPVPTTSFLENPDRFLGLFTPEQIQEEYPNQFIKTNVDLTPLVFEASPGKEEARNTETERFLFTKRNVFTFTSDGSFNIWDLDMTDDINLRAITGSAIALAVRNSNQQEPKDNVIIIPRYDKVIRITHLPPSPSTSKYIKDTLDRRKKLLQE